MWIFVKTFHSNHCCQRCHHYRKYRSNVLSLVISDYFHKNNQLTLDWKFKNNWTKRLQKIPRKINASLSLSKKNLPEKNEWNLSNQSGEVTRASIYLTNCRRSLFFSVTLFRAWFYDNQFSKIKFNLLKILEAFQEHTRTMLVKLQSFIPQFNQFHPVCYYHIASLDAYFWIYV